MSEWIAAKEKPKAGEVVLVVYLEEYYGFHSIGIASWNKRDRDWSFYMGCGSSGPVSHWMPLPALPEGLPEAP